MKERPLVILEPELEAEVSLYLLGQRLELAKKLERWAKQLRLWAIKIMGDHFASGFGGTAEEGTGFFKSFDAARAPSL